MGTNNTKLMGTNNKSKSLGLDKLDTLNKLFKIYTTPFYKFNINKSGSIRNISNEVGKSFGLMYMSYYFNEKGTAFNAIYNKTDDTKQQIIDELSIYNRINTNTFNKYINYYLRHTNLNLKINDDLNIIRKDEFNNMPLKDILLKILKQYINYDVINIFSFSSGKYPIAEMYMIHLIRCVLGYSGMNRILFIDMIYNINSDENVRDLILFLDKFRNLDFKYDILRMSNEELINNFINNQKRDIQQKYNDRFSINLKNQIDINNNNIDNINLFFEFDKRMRSMDNRLYKFLKEKSNILFEMNNMGMEYTTFNYTVNYNMRGG